MYYDPYRPDDQIPVENFRVENIPEKKRRNARGWTKLLALCLVCVLVGGAAGMGGTAVYHMIVAPDQPQTPIDNTTALTIYESSREPTAVNVSYTNMDELRSLEEIYAIWVNSTVGITTQVTTNVYGQQVSRATAGSGFVISRDGYIVTNYHVINGANSVSVSFFDGTEYEATVVGGEKTNDVAVLKIKAEDLTPVVLGNSDHLKVGETVTAIGNPLGELTFTQTAGIVSALNRMITMSDSTKMNMIQTDCTINSGNSGGPLFNLYGEVIGITSAKYSNNGSSGASIEGIGFAIPINDVIDMVKDIIEYGYVTGKPHIGVSVATVSEQDALRYNLVVGAYVNTVEAGSPAEAAGLRRGDVITAMDGTKIVGGSDLIAQRNAHRAGDTVELTVYRAGQELTLKLTFGEGVPEMVTEPAQQPQTQQQWPQQGGEFSFGWPFGGGFGW